MNQGRSYKQYCPLARAFDIIGERWTILIVRDLLFSPKRFKDLEQNLVGMGKNLLSKRLKDLMAQGVIERVYMPPPVGADVYRLTSTGEELRDPIVSLSKWGAKHFIEDEPREDDRVQFDWQKVLELS